MGRGLEFGEHVGGAAVTGRDDDRYHARRAKGPPAYLLDPSHGADGDPAMVKKLKAHERGIALLVVLTGIALMTLIIVDFSTTAALGYLSAANQSNELRAYY